MQALKVVDDHGVLRWLLAGEDGVPVEIVGRFLKFLQNRSLSPNTVAAYARDLTLFFRFLDHRGLTYEAIGPALVVEFLDFLTHLPVRRPGKRQALAVVTADAGGSGRRRAGSSINRTMAAVSSFYEFVITVEECDGENPVRKVDDVASGRVADRHRPFMGRASRQRPVRRAVRVKTVRGLPRPMAPEDVMELFATLTTQRDRAIFLLMLDGGLRPGEVLGLRIPDDVEYGRRRVHVRHRDDHPKGVRQKSRTDRVVDLHDPRTLAAVSDYVMTERPRDSGSPFLFLVGGRGRRRCEPLGYQALWASFARRCSRLGIRTPWTTPHALRHTHATAMWESGMRELTLQKRLGHASPESTRIYTRVSDPEVLADYEAATAAIIRRGEQAR
ncbi:tyrosine-type recombinase/integrase [Micromonospora sp. WMMD1102]|uniref:tyrosine-type recombinase/integrase n=1 Tax=Micromonospora sp. WMMD1102 TaxID=3016105 RepID=UPI0024153DFA|nr:tyrosine-type recombinase/integrase [Micromonospora sp. WMMD1102]MDG4790206.1 tyrosine-type recombinase/integrase [Micromonospora sp. WMMD1102]